MTITPCVCGKIPMVRKVKGWWVVDCPAGCLSAWTRRKPHALAEWNFLVQQQKARVRP